MTDRVEAAAMAVNAKHEVSSRFFLPWSELVRSDDKANRHRVARDWGYARAALEAADAHDAEQGIRRVRMDAAAVKRVARVIAVSQLGTQITPYERARAHWHEMAEDLLEILTVEAQ